MATTHLKLISEHIEHDTDYLIEESENGKKNYKIKNIKSYKNDLCINMRRH